MSRASGQDVVPSTGAPRARWWRLRRKGRAATKPAGQDGAQPPDLMHAEPTPAGVPGTGRIKPSGGGVKASAAPPIQVLIGWVAEAARKDVIAHARGIAEDQLAALDQAWLALAPYRGGFFYEVHEGGAGKAYLPEIIEQLDRDPDQIIWMSAGTAINRVMTVGITDNVPYAVILTENESALVRQSGQEPIRRGGRMRRLISSGQGMLVSGAVVAAASLGVLGLSLHHARGLAQQPPMLVSYQPDVLPFRRIIDLTSMLPDDRWLLFVLYENGTWRSEYATSAPLVLPDDDAGARMIAAEVRAAGTADSDSRGEDLGATQLDGAATAPPGGTMTEGTSNVAGPADTPANAPANSATDAGGGEQ